MSLVLPQASLGLNRRLPAGLSEDGRLRGLPHREEHQGVAALPRRHCRHLLDALILSHACAQSQTPCPAAR